MTSVIMINILGLIVAALLKRNYNAYEDNNSILVLIKLYLLASIAALVLGCTIFGGSKTNLSHIKK